MLIKMDHFENDFLSIKWSIPASLYFPERDTNSPPSDCGAGAEVVTTIIALKRLLTNNHVLEN